MTSKDDMLSSSEEEAMCWFFTYLSISSHLLQEDWKQTNIQTSKHQKQPTFYLADIGSQI